MESSAQSEPNWQVVSPTNVVFEEPIQTKKSTHLTFGEVGTAAKKGKVPKRLVHFSDGVLEEYSTDDGGEEDTIPSIDPRKLAWLPWLWYYLVFISSGALSAADVCGEKLAWFFGITSPKYQYAIDEFERIKAEEEEENQMQEREKEVERQRSLGELGAAEGGVAVAYTSTTDKVQDNVSNTSSVGVMNAAFEPESLSVHGEGEKY